MSWDEPLAIARRLAIRLDVPVSRWPKRAAARDDILLVSATQLADVTDEILAAVTAAVVVGDPGAATSGDLTALRELVAARAGTSVVLTAFATVPSSDDGAREVPLAIAVPSDAGGRRGDASGSRVAELLAAGPHALTLDDAVDVSAVSPQDPPARVCVVSFEVSGMTGGGIGTASTSLAETLAREGHDVTFLFTGWQEPAAAERNAHWRRHYAARGVRLEVLRAPGVNTVKNPHFPARSAYEVYCWLRREQPFDVVHLPENMGHGAYAQLAKAQGAAFATTTFAIGTHGPTRWAAEANRVSLTREEFLVNEALERTSVALADVLLGPSRYLHDYKRARGWKLPERVHVQPYAVPSAVRPEPTSVPADVRSRTRAAALVDAPGQRSSGGEPAASGLPDEIVFFGRLETRKGVATLCDALDQLALSGDLPAFAVTFLGPLSHVFGRPSDAYIADRARQWPWSWQIVSDRDQQGAAEYLARPGVLAVMPSTVDNAPNTVSEAVALGIPLVAGRTGGTGELVAAEQRDDHMFGSPPGSPLLPLPLSAVVAAPDATPLAQLLRRRLTTTVAAARPPVPSDAVDAAYDRWHRAVACANRRAEADAPQQRPQPSLAIGVLFEGDAQLLGEQLEALAGADVTVVDLRSDVSSAIPAARGVATVRPQRPGHVGDGCTAVVAATTADVIAFVPAGDVPLPSFADETRRAAATGADVCACAVLDERDMPGGVADAPDEIIDAPGDDPAVRAFVPLPGPALAGLTHPAFCAGPYAIRRDALARLGGFSADAHADEADHELLNRAAVAGLRIEPIPQPLAAKRRSDRWTTLRGVWPHDGAEPPYDAEQWLRVERPFTAADAGLADAVGLLRGAREEAVHLQATLHDQQQVYEARSAEQRTWIDDLEEKAAKFREDQERLVAEVAALRADNGRLQRLNAEMSQSAAQLTVRTIRDAGKRVVRRVKR